jgi:hypothetical protein
MSPSKIEGALAALFFLYFGFSPFILECFLPASQRHPDMPRWLGWVLLAMPPGLVGLGVLL